MTHPAAPTQVSADVTPAVSVPGPTQLPTQGPTQGSTLGYAPAFLPATTHSYLLRAAESLSAAVAAHDVATRYASAHVAALRAAAALLSARARPTAGRRRSQRNAWVLLAEVAPEMGEWASFFAAGAAKRAAAEAGSVRAVSAREADDLVREADRFLGQIEESLGLTAHQSPAQSRAVRAAG